VLVVVEQLVFGLVLRVLFLAPATALGGQLLGWVVVLVIALVFDFFHGGSWSGFALRVPVGDAGESRGGH